MIEIFGKDSCIKCVQAKQLCESKNLDYDYKSLGKDFSAEEMFELFPNARTFPQIKIDGKSIGGYDQLVLHVN